MKNILWMTVIMTVIMIACDTDDNDTDTEQRPANEVGMTAASFVPADLTVTAGTTVRWVNTSNVAHNVVSETGLFTSEILNPGQAYTFTFDVAGIYDYECTIHPGMTGTITVQSGGNSNGSDGY